MTLIAFKALDMVTKLILLQKIENKEPLGAFANIIERNVDIPFFIKVTASLLYIGLFHAAFGPALDNLHHMV